MQLLTTSIPDVLLIKPRLFSDSRGFFMETFQTKTFTQNGVPVNFVQDNHSGSKRGTLRGLHYQIHHAQGKLVRVVSGEVFDVAVDLRRSSPTFGQSINTILSAENKHLLWIPKGFAHSFFVLSDWAEMVYKSTDYYLSEWERTFIWNDPALAIP